MSVRSVRLKYVVSLFFCFLSLGPIQAAPVPWPQASFTYIADKQALPQVLASFSRTFGIDLKATQAVLERNEIVNGKITTTSPSEFLNQVGATYGFQWFYSNGSLYISRNSETATRSLSPNGMGLANFRKALTDLGIVEPKFGWGEVPDRGVAMISGPPAYVDQVAWAVATMPLTPPDQQIRVFRLKYAQVNDRVISYRDQRITTAGVATILRSLVTGEASAAGTSTLTSSSMPLLNTLAAPLRGDTSERQNESNEAGKGGASGNTPAEGSGASSSSVGTRMRPVIQADSRLNAVIIKDNPQRMQIYEELISVLDVPSQLVEIEAVIVDVNSSRISDLGIDWGGRFGQVAGGFGTPAKVVDGVTGTIALGKGVSPNTVVMNAGDFLMARIRILEGDGDARVVSRPSILTQDNLGALIDLSETFYVQAIGERVANVVPVSVGVTLRVTPHIIERGGNQSVHLVVDIEDGTLQDRVVQTLPTIRRSSISTQAVMGEQESLLIGGFNSQQDMRSEDRVPLLAGLPFIGILFKKKTTKVEKRERLFLITPKIISATPLPVNPPAEN